MDGRQASSVTKHSRTSLIDICLCNHPIQLHPGTILAACLHSFQLLRQTFSLLTRFKLVIRAHNVFHRVPVSASQSRASCRHRAPPSQSHLPCTARNNHTSTRSLDSPTWQLFNRWPRRTLSPPCLAGECPSPTIPMPPIRPSAKSLLRQASVHEPRPLIHAIYYTANLPPRSRLSS